MHACKTRAIRRRPARSIQRRRKGALLSAELIFAMPIIVALFLAMIEFGLLLVAQQKMEVAAREACRVGSVPSADPVATEKAVSEAAARALGSKQLVNSFTCGFTPGQYTGDSVSVVIRVPMKAAAPDMLGLIGFGLGSRQLTAQCVMRKE